MIINYCKEFYIKYQGILNNNIVRLLVSKIKDLLLGEWLIIVCYIDKDIYYNISSTYDENKYIIFFLDDKKFYIIGY